MPLLREGIRFYLAHMRNVILCTKLWPGHYSQREHWGVPTFVASFAFRVCWMSWTNSSDSSQSMAHMLGGQTLSEPRGAYIVSDCDNYMYKIIVMSIWQHMPWTWPRSSLVGHHMIICMKSAHMTSPRKITSRFIMMNYS